jgi:hypothetical protein
MFDFSNFCLDRVVSSARAVLPGAFSCGRPPGFGDLDQCLDRIGCRVLDDCLGAPARITTLAGLECGPRRFFMAVVT